MVTEGARRKEESWDPEENGQIALPGAAHTDDSVLGTIPLMRDELHVLSTQTKRSSSDALAMRLRGWRWRRRARRVRGGRLTPWPTC